MFKYFLKNTLLLLIYLIISSGCSIQNKQELILPAADRVPLYINFLKNKNVGIIANQTSVIFKNKTQTKYTHIVDSLLSMGIKITKVFAPEHGFRGKADAGEYINNEIDKKTKLPIISIYGKNKKPSKEQLQGIDVILFDIQDVGVRFYTYISTLHYIMEACAEQNIPLIVLDRPNPNGHYIDGPILEKEFVSFVGIHPYIPIVYGMTIGEYSQMINGEKWLKNGLQCDLIVIPLKNYNHQSKYRLPIKPSPNLPNEKSINLYPSICLFEGTNISCGRGTEMQFQIFGSPFLPKEKYKFSFKPQPNFGSKKPKHNGEFCYGIDLRNNEYLNELNIEWLIASYNFSSNKEEFFNAFFYKLSGTKKLREQIESNLSIPEIKKSWEEGLNEFSKIRKKYLIYD